MKKSLSVILGFSTLLFFSCASKASPEETDSTIQIPEITSEETMDSTENSDSEENENAEDNQNYYDDEIEFLDEELQDIIEPTVITLSPEEDNLQKDSSNDEQNQGEEPVSQEDSDPDELQPDSTITDEQSADSDALSNNGTITTDEDSAADNAGEVEDVEEIGETNDTGSDDVFDVSNDDLSSEEAETEEIEIIPSRKVTLNKLDYVDITYPGSGWIYMGLTDNSKDLSYFGRKLGTGETKFTLQAKTSGTKIIHFYKNDPLTNTYIDDFIEVEILETKGNGKTHVEAPAYKTPVPKKSTEKVSPKIEITAQAESTETKAAPAAVTTSSEQKTEKQPEPVTKAAPAPAELPTQTAQINSEQDTSINQNVDTDALLKEAQKLFNEKKFSDAIGKLNQFFEYSSTKRDEALYLQGQIYEANSDIQNIKAAINSYNTLMKNYPASKFWDKANKRVIYLKKFYLEAF